MKLHDASQVPLALRLVPRRVVEHIVFQRKVQRGAQRRSHEIHGIVSILDISGFSALCEKCSTDETLMEELCTVINGAFSAEVAVVQEYGGEVLCFLGDGLLVVWPVPEGNEAQERALAVELDDAAAADERSDAAKKALKKGRSASVMAFVSGGRSNSVPSGSLAAANGSFRVAEGGGGGGGGGGQRATAEQSVLHRKMQALAARAVECGLRVQEACVGIGASMKLRVAVAAGDFAEYFCGIGGATGCGDGRAEGALVDERGHAVPGRMSHLIAGPAIEECGVALGEIKPGEVAVCASALRFLPASAVLPRGVKRRAGSVVMANVSEGEESGLSGLSGGEGPAPAGAAGGGGAGGGGGGGGGLVVAHPSVRESLAGFALKAWPPVFDAQGMPSDLTDEEREAVALYVPYTVRARLDDMEEWAAAEAEGQGQGGAFDPTRFLNEFRVVSVMFCKLAGLESSPEAVQRAVRTLQAVIYSHEGSLLTIAHDDKGLILIAGFGLWPVAHEDDPSRCVACALDMRLGMRAMGVTTHIGITTGLVFCTFVGCPQRCNFSFFGTVVNRAARLMGKSGGEVYVDARTHEGCRLRMKMEHVADFELKGIDGKVPVYRPAARRASLGGELLHDAAGGGASAPRLELVGRSAEAARVQELVERTSAAAAAASAAASAAAAPVGLGKLPEGVEVPSQAPPPPPVLLFEGASGTGKSVLCGHAAHLAARRGMSVATSAGLESRSLQPLYLWRSILRTLFPLGLMEMGPLLEESEVESLPQLAAALNMDRAPAAHESGDGPAGHAFGPPTGPTGRRGSVQPPGPVGPRRASAPGGEQRKRSVQVQTPREDGSPPPKTGRRDGSPAPLELAEPAAAGAAGADCAGPERPEGRRSRREGGVGPRDGGGDGAGRGGRRGDAPGGPRAPRAWHVHQGSPGAGEAETPGDPATGPAPAPAPAPPGGGGGHGDDEVTALHSFREGAPGTAREAAGPGLPTRRTSRMGEGGADPLGFAASRRTSRAAAGVEEFYGRLAPTARPSFRGQSFGPHRRKVMMWVSADGEGSGSASTLAGGIGSFKQSSGGPGSAAAATPACPLPLPLPNRSADQANRTAAPMSSGAGAVKKGWGAVRSKLLAKAGGGAGAPPAAAAKEDGGGWAALRTRLKQDHKLALPDDGDRAPKPPPPQPLQPPPPQQQPKMSPAKPAPPTAAAAAAAGAAGTPEKKEGGRGWAALRGRLQAKGAGALAGGGGEADRPKEPAAPPAPRSSPAPAPAGSPKQRGRGWAILRERIAAEGAQGIISKLEAAGGKPLNLPKQPELPLQYRGRGIRHRWAGLVSMLKNATKSAPPAPPPRPSPPASKPAALAGGPKQAGRGWAILRERMAAEGARGIISKLEAAGGKPLNLSRLAAPAQAQGRGIRHRWASLIASLKSGGPKDGRDADGAATSRSRGGRRTSRAVAGGADEAEAAEAAAEATRALLVRLLVKRAATGRPVLLILEGPPPSPLSRPTLAFG
eukprot:tig00021073_g18038.t1